MALLIPLAVFSLVAGGCEPDFELRGKNEDFLVVGHRGAPFVAAENTIESMESATRIGANAIETDLCTTSDGEVVLWHDRDPDDVLALGRQEGLEGLPWVPFVPPDGSPARRPVDELTLATFLAEYGYSRDGGDTRDPEAPIAVLADLMDFARRDSDVRVLYLDFKVVDPVQAARILDLVSAQAPPDVTMILMSPRRDVVEAFIVERARIGADTLRIAWDVVSEDALDGTLELGLRDVSTGIAIRSETLFLEEIVEAVEARRDGRIDSVTASTIDRRQLLGQLLYRDVDGVMTNHPDVLYDLWQLTL